MVLNWYSSWSYRSCNLIITNWQSVWTPLADIDSEFDDDHEIAPETASDAWTDLRGEIEESNII